MFRVTAVVGWILAIAAVASAAPAQGVTFAVEAGASLATLGNRSETFPGTVESVTDLTKATARRTFTAGVLASVPAGRSGHASDILLRGGVRYREIGGEHTYHVNAFVGLHYTRRFVQRYVAFPVEIEYRIAGSSVFVAGGAEASLLVHQTDEVSYLVGSADDRSLDGARRLDAALLGAVGMEIDTGLRPVRLAYELGWGLLSNLTAVGDGYSRRHSLSIALVF